MQQNDDYLPRQAWDKRKENQHRRRFMQVFPMEEIWVSPEEVRDAKRVFPPAAAAAATSTIAAAAAAAAA